MLISQSHRLTILRKTLIANFKKWIAKFNFELILIEMVNTLLYNYIWSIWYAQNEQKWDSHTYHVMFTHPMINLVHI